jgi:uncharacterized protein (DUF1697 family)
MPTRSKAESGARLDGDTYVALLRGINVGGKNKLPMRDLAALFTDAGCRRVRTYIQSGNVVFEARPSVADRLPHDIATRIDRAFALRVPVVLRAARELDEVVRGNPFLARGAEAEALHVMFLADLPAPGAVSALDANRSPPDEFAVIGREVYLRCPFGIGRSKLTNGYFDTKLTTTSTCRNWRTVLSLVELANT